MVLPLLLYKFFYFSEKVTVNYSWICIKTRSKTNATPFIRPKQEKSYKNFTYSTK